MTEVGPEKPAWPALASHVGGVLGRVIDRLEIAPVAGGQSNPTYFVTAGRDRLVLRKQPVGDLLPSAHAIDREFRVLSALRGSGVPVPAALDYCADRSIVGTPFYLMRRVDGRVHHDGALDGAAKADRRAMYRSLAEVLARLHAVDPDEVGLGDFGRKGDYFARQIARWSKQWDLSRDRNDPNVDHLVDWLPRNVPDDTLSALAHGDYRLGNVLFHPTEPRIAAVLDWELSTLGHPLADLAHCCMVFVTPPDLYSGIAGLSGRDSGLPELGEFLAFYGAHATHGQTLKPFHMAFALFRFAVVFEGIAARARAGSAVDAQAQRVGSLSARFAQVAAGFTDRTTLGL